MRMFVAANLARGLATIAMGLCSFLAAPASGTTFLFEQTMSSVPGFFVSSAITIDGGFADLPTVSNFNNPGPYPFGDGFALKDFVIVLTSGGGGRGYTLADFTAQCLAQPCSGGGPPFFPQWHISPTRIDFVDKIDQSDFIINGFGALSTIGFDTDAPVFPCNETGRCIATGIWAPIPEPASVMLLIAALIGTALGLRKRNLAERG